MSDDSGIKTQLLAKRAELSSRLKASQDFLVQVRGAPQTE